MSILNFLNLLRREISTYTKTISQRENTVVDTDRRYDILKYQLASAYYQLIEFYFRETGITGDNNIMTEDEMELVVSKLNNIMDTNLYYEF